jgi:hypothetical protein
LGTIEVLRQKFLKKLGTIEVLMGDSLKKVGTIEALMGGNRGKNVKKFGDYRSLNRGQPGKL